MPLLLFSPGVLGSLPYDLGLAAMTAAMVNLHHFVLDGAIWKLRESRVRRVLLSTGATAPDALATRALPLARTLVAAGAVSLAVLLFGAIEEEFGLLRGLRRGDLASAESSLDRLSWIGRDSSVTRAELGALRMRKGEAEAAERQIEIGLKVLPTASAWIHLGEARAFQGKSRGSMEAYRSALVLEPGNVTAKLLLGLAHAGVGESDRARALLDQCDRRAEDTPGMRDLRNRLETALAVRPGA
jgi:tetratricopeptide (TPR) repeat protein